MNTNRIVTFNAITIIEWIYKQLQQILTWVNFTFNEKVDLSKEIGKDDVSAVFLFELISVWSLSQYQEIAVEIQFVLSQKLRFRQDCSNCFISNIQLVISLTYLFGYYTF